MRVLITCHALDAVGGIQTHCRDVALWLLHRGHSPVVYAPRHGAAAEMLARLTIPVIDDLSMLAERPDVIHGNSAVQTVAAMLWFSETPAIYVCHAPRGNDLIPRFSRVRRYVAVDDTCRDRLVSREGIPPQLLSVVLNGVDLERFTRRLPLPPQPRRAVVFGNSANELTHLAAIRQACSERGIEVDAIGHLTGTAVNDPESILGQYDIAFAKAKCALEAMACGLAVILCDNAGMGGLVRRADVDALRRLNFGVRSLREPVSVERIKDEIARYDADDARRVSDVIRATASADAMSESLFSVYEEAIQAHTAQPAMWRDESRDAARFLESMTDREQPDRYARKRILRTSDRILRIPLVGGLMRRFLRWLIA